MHVVGKRVADLLEALDEPGRPVVVTHGHDAAVGAQGFRVVLLLRLSPLFPFNLLNYALGLTRVRLRDFVLASLPGMLPGTLLYVYLGSLVTSVSQLTSGQRPDSGPWGRVLFWGGLVATAGR
jgi:uncharacterized membrane protein YdjX (TVP38/TMEM64 family)